MDSTDTRPERIINLFVTGLFRGDLIKSSNTPYNENIELPLFLNGSSETTPSLTVIILSLLFLSSDLFTKFFVKFNYSKVVTSPDLHSIPLCYIRSTLAIAAADTVASLIFAGRGNAPHTSSCMGEA